MAGTGAGKVTQPYAEIGIFGGSGFYSFLDNVQEFAIHTPYGAPSDRIAIGELAGRKVAFLPRHGRNHHIPPHKINYRANIWAMKEIGVTRLIGPCAAGSLKPEIKPGHFVVTDQFVNRTWGREDTFYEGPIVTHIGAAEPYCPVLRRVAIDAAHKLGIPVHEKGTVVVVQGPRFSTKAESKEFASHGWDVINMTQYPEGMLARELEICYVNIALVTDYDVGLEDDPSVEPVSHEGVIKVFNENNAKLRELLFEMIRTIPPKDEPRACLCATALAAARG